MVGKVKAKEAGERAKRREVYDEGDILRAGKGVGSVFSL